MGIGWNTVYNPTVKQMMRLALLNKIKESYHLSCFVCHVKE